MKKFLVTLLSIIAVLSIAIPASAGKFSAAYRVNSDVITFYEIDQMTLLLEATGANPSQSRAKAVEFLINDRLVRGETRRIGVEVEPILVTRTLDTMGGGEGKGNDLRKRFNALGIADETIDTYVTSQILRRSYADLRGGSRVVTAEERTQRIVGIPDQVTKTVSISEIVIPYAEYGGRIPARYQRKIIVQRYNNGESFASLAREFSRSPTAAKGGLIPEIPEEGLNPQLKKVVENSAPGKLAAPIESEGAIILIRFNGYSENSVSLPKDPLVSYVDLFVNGANGLENSKAQANKLLAEVQTCKYAKAKVEKLPNSHDYEDVPVSSLSSGVSLTLARMETGTAAIFERESGTSVLYLCDRQIKVPDNLQEVVNSRAQNDSVDSRINGLLRDLRASATIVNLE